MKAFLGPGGRGGGAYHQVDPYKVPELVEDLLTGFLVPLRLAPEFYVGGPDVSSNSGMCAGLVTAVIYVENYIFRQPKFNTLSNNFQRMLVSKLH